MSVQPALPEAGERGGAGVGVEADLTVNVDTGPRRRATTQISGVGHELRVHIDRPEIVLAAAGRRAATTLAGELGAGIHLEVHGRGRRLAVLDPRRVSRVGALLGSRHLHLRPAAGLAVARAAVPARRR